jgi:WD40 repeat protein
LHADEARLHLQLGHSKEVKYLAFSPDSKLLLTASKDSTLRLWETAGGREIRATAELTHEPLGIAFSPDGQTFAAIYEAKETANASITIFSTATGAELRSLTVHGPNTDIVAETYHFSFSPDGKSLLVGDIREEWATRVIKVGGGEQVGKFDAAGRISFSADGKRVLIGSKLFDYPTARLLREFDCYAWSTLSADGKRVLGPSTTEIQGTRIWDSDTGKVLREFQMDSRFSAVAFFPDGKNLLLSTSSLEGYHSVDGDTGINLREFPGTGPAAVSPDGHRVAIGAPSIITTPEGGGPHLYDASTGREIALLSGHSSKIKGISVSSDACCLATRTADGKSQLWDLAKGNVVDTYEAAISFSPYRPIVIASSGNGAKLLSSTSGDVIAQFEGFPQSPESYSFSADGRELLTLEANLMFGLTAATLWDLESGKKLADLDVGEDSILSGALSSDDRYAATGGILSGHLWDAREGKELWKFPAQLVALSPDGRFLFGAEWGNASLWDLTTRQKVQSFESKEGWDFAAATFLPDSETLITADEHENISFRDRASGREISKIPGNAVGDAPIVLSPDGRFLAVGSADGATRLYRVPASADLRSGKPPQLTATLISFQEGGWAVVDPDGRYDASDPDNATGLYWRVGAFQTIGLSQLRREFYTPGLLRRIWNGDRLPPVTGLNNIAHLPPVCEAEISGTPQRPALRVTLSEVDSSGYGSLVVKINGRPYTAPVLNKTTAQGRETILLDLAGAEFAEGANEIKVTAASSDNLIQSEAAAAAFTGLARARIGGRQTSAAARKSSSDGCGGKFYGVFIGTGNFPFAPDLKLLYPEEDARALSEAVRAGAEQLCGKDNVHISMLTTDQQDKSMQPNKENIRRVLETVAHDSRREDMLMLYLSGHGASPAGNKDAWFYFTQDAHDIDVNRADALRQSSTVSVEELKTWLQNPNLPDKQIVILDTCAAGAAAKEFSELVRARSEADDRAKAADNFNQETGAYFLFGAAGNRLSFESPRLHHGLLTYSLLRAMKTEPPLVDGGRLDAARWFEAARQNVKNYSKIIHADQEPQKATPTAQGGVPVGFFPPDLREKIAVSQPAAEILHLSYCYEAPEKNKDPLKIGAAVRSELRALTGPGARAPGAADDVIYNDDARDEESQDALTPQVTYRSKDGRLEVTITLLKGGAELKNATLTVDAPGPEGISVPTANAIARAIVELAHTQ